MDSDVVSLLRGMLEVQAESLRLQRLLVERLLGAQPAAPADDRSERAAPPPTAPTAPPPPTPPTPVPLQPPPPHSPLPQSPPPPTQAGSELPPPPTPSPRPPPPVDDLRSRGARYYQARPSPAAQTIKPEELELMRRLQQMREASGLILQFGPFKGTTLAQVAIGHPEYVRDLVISARRPEVRAAAGQLVEALDAAAEHKRKTPRGTTRRAHASSERYP